MAQIETWFDQDLQEPVKVHNIDGNLFSNNASGNRIGVIVTNNGEPVALSGTVRGYAVLSDGSTVQCSGSRSGNRASVVVPASAYKPGPIFVSVVLTDGIETTTLVAVASVVMRTY